MTELERLELALRSVAINDTCTPTQLLDAIIREITIRNNEAVQGRKPYAEAAELDGLRTERRRKGS